MRCFHVWLLLLAYRLLGVVLIQSWFVPDELYQSAEVAHRAVFGTGHLSWEWKYGLRSPFHPLMIAAIYDFLKRLGLDSRTLVANAPRVFHALLFSVGDICFWNLSRRLLLTKQAALYSFIAYLSSWFIIYCAPRLLSNSLETVLTLIALHWYPFKKGNLLNGTVWPYISIGCLAIIIRPTAALIWAVFGLAHLARHPRPIRLIMLTVLPAALPILLLSLVADSLCYARLTSSLWNFLTFNVLQGGSAHFGVHPWYWYLTEGLTSVLTIHLFPIILGLMSPFRPTLLPFVAAVFYIAFHSLLPHKEQRFLLPLIPLLCLYTGPYFAAKHTNSRRMLLILMVFFNAVVAIYCGVRHQVGPYNAADSVLNMAKDASESVLSMAAAKGNISVLALMPCYSIPGYSYFHEDVQSLRMLDCSPKLDSEIKTDESDSFHLEPQMWIEKHLDEIRSHSHLLLYEKMYDRLHLTFDRLRYTLCDRVFHADVLTSDREDHHVVVLCKDLDI